VKKSAAPGNAAETRDGGASRAPLLAANFLSRVRRFSWSIVTAVVGRCSANQRIATATPAASATAAATPASGTATTTSTSSSAHSVSDGRPGNRRSYQQNCSEYLQHVFLRV
jgi:hypothetical protein